MLKKIFLLSLASSTIFFNLQIAFGQFKLVSTGYSQGELSSQSSDGRYVAFQTYFPYYLQTFNTDPYFQIYVRDLDTGNLELVSANYSQTGAGKGDSFSPKISPDGRYIAFLSKAPNLVQSIPIVQTLDKAHLFVRNLETKITYLVPLPSLPNNARRFNYVGHLISSDGRFVVFEVQFDKSRTQFPGYKQTKQDSRVYVWDRETGQTQPVSTNIPLVFGAQIRSLLSAISPDGRFIVFANRSVEVPPETSPFLGLFVRDMVTGEIERIDARVTNFPNDSTSVANAFISNDGRYVVFEHYSNNLTNIPDNNNVSDIFIRDRASQTTRLISSNYSQTAASNGWSWLSSVSSDARFVVFTSTSKDLISNHPAEHPIDVFVWDALSDSKICASRDIPNLGSEPNGYLWAGISHNGDQVMIPAFKRPAETSTWYRGEIFVLNTVSNQLTMVSNSPNSHIMGSIIRPSITRDGKRIIFQTTLSLLPIMDGNGVFDIYAYSFGTGF